MTQQEIKNRLQEIENLQKYGMKTKPNCERVQLQGIGWKNAVLASDLIAGDKIICNYGYIDDVADVKDVSKCFVEVVYSTGGTRRFKKTNKIAVARLNKE